MSQYTAYEMAEASVGQEHIKYVPAIKVSSIDINVVLPHKAKIYAKATDICPNRKFKERFGDRK